LSIWQLLILRIPNNLVRTFPQYFCRCALFVGDTSLAHAFAYNSAALVVLLAVSQRQEHSTRSHTDHDDITPAKTLYESTPTDIPVAVLVEQEDVRLDITAKCLRIAQ